MEWSTVVVLVLAIPVILIPIALIWYINVGGIIVLLDKRRRNAAAKWLFDFERKGTMAWERQGNEIHQYYRNQVDSLLNQTNKR